MWEKRSRWIEKEIDIAVSGGHEVSDHAAALFIELQACYCIGAWISVIILATSVIDAHLRETEANDKKIGTAELLKNFYKGPENIDWLRNLRNKYVHLQLDSSPFKMNAQFGDRSQWEENATKAMRMVIKSFFQNPGTKIKLFKENPGAG